MYKVKDLEFTTLDEAMQYAKFLNEFATITDLDSQFEIVGKFGVDSIENGVCPDGVPYTWMKRRSQ